jgi:large subunit ribosomal protein L22
MGQKANPRRLADNEASAYAKFVRSSPRKLNLVAQLIRGKAASTALVDLDFCPRRIAREVKKTLMSAVANAENNHNLDVDRLVVAEATVGRQMVMKRFIPRARGRAGAIEKWFSNLTIIVREHDESEGAK